MTIRGLIHTRILHEKSQVLLVELHGVDEII